MQFEHNILDRTFKICPKLFYQHSLLFMVCQIIIIFHLFIFYCYQSQLIFISMNFNI